MSRPTVREIDEMVYELQHEHDDTPGVETSFVAWWIIFGMMWCAGHIDTAELRRRWDEKPCRAKL